MSWVRRKRREVARPVVGAVGVLRERVSIQAHLAHCELRLRLTTRPDQTARLELLEILHEYWRAGRFPRNTAAGGRRPVFIDDSGTHCAVGYLMACTGAGRVARELDRRDRFVLLEDLPSALDPRLRRWLDKHQLSREEAALIQPGYGPCGMAGWNCDGYVHAGTAATDTMVAAASLVVSLGLLAPAVLLVWMARRGWATKALRVLQNWWWLLLAVVVTFPLAGATLYGESRELQLVWEAAMWMLSGLVVSLVVIRLWRWGQQRPMIGFDEGAGMYKHQARALFMVLAAMLFWDVALPDGSGQAMPTVRRWHVDILVLPALPLLWAHQSLQRCSRRIGLSVVAAFAVCAAVLTVVLPSPLHAAATLRPGDRIVVCSSTAGPVCVENGNEGTPPRLFKLSAWKTFDEHTHSDQENPE